MLTPYSVNITIKQFVEILSKSLSFVNNDGKTPKLSLKEPDFEKETFNCHFTGHLCVKTFEVSFCFGGLFMFSSLYIIEFTRKNPNLSSRSKTSYL